MVMWKDFVDRILNAAERCSRTLCMIYMLSTGGEDGEKSLKVPDMGLFRPETDDEMFRLENTDPDVERILKVLDVNCINEDAVSSRVWGKKKTSGLCCGVGLWILPSFVNHSCCPNVRRLHIGDWLVMHASRDLKEGEEVTFAYFDPLLPLEERRGLSKRWGFVCDCPRCKFEEEEEDLGREFVLREYGEVVMRLEEQMKKKGIGKKEKGFMRASLWSVYAGLYETEKTMRRLGRRILAEMVVAESVMEAVGGDERVLRAALGSLKRNGGRWMEVERLMKMGRGVYGKVMKKQGMRALFDQLN